MATASRDDVIKADFTVGGVMLGEEDKNRMV